MDKKDFLTFIIAIFLVVAISFILNPPDFSSNAGTQSQNQVQENESAYYSDSSYYYDNIRYSYIAEIVDPPFNIDYNNNLKEIYSPGPQGYPRLRLPGNDYAPVGNYYAPDKYAENQPTNMDTYTNSDLFSSDIWGDDPHDIKTIAIMEGNESGFSEIFGIPYQLSRIKCTIMPKGNPAYSRLMWVLVDSDTGDIITGGNIFPEGEIIKEVSTYNKEMYFIIEARNVFSFTLELQTPAILYDNKYPKHAESSLIDFMNTMDG